MNCKRTDMRRALPIWLRRRSALYAVRGWGNGRRRAIERFYRLYYWQR